MSSQTFVSLFGVYFRTYLLYFTCASLVMCSLTSYQWRRRSIAFVKYLAVYVTFVFLPILFAEVSCMELEFTLYYLVFLLDDHLFCQCNKVRHWHCPKNIRFASVLHMSLSISFHTHWQYSTFFIHIVNRNQSRHRSKYKNNWPWLGQFFASCHHGGLILITCHFVCDLCRSVRHWDSFSPIFLVFSSVLFHQCFILLH